MKSNHVLTDSFPGSKLIQVIMGVAVAGGVAVGVVLTIIILKVVPRCCRRQRGKLVHLLQLFVQQTCFDYSLRFCLKVFDICVQHPNKLELSFPCWCLFG